MTRNRLIIMLIALLIPGVAGAEFLLLASAVQNDGVRVFDTATGELVTHYGPPVGVPSVFGLEWDGRYLLSVQQGRDLWSVDAAFVDAMFEFSLPNVDPWGIVLANGSLYVNGQASTGIDTIYRLDPSNGQILNRFAMPDSVDNLRDLAFDGTKLWGVDSSHREVFRIDPATGVFEMSHALPGSSGFAIAWDATLSRLWYVDVTGTAYRIDVGTGSFETAHTFSGTIARSALIRDSVVPIQETSWGGIKSVFASPSP